MAQRCTLMGPARKPLVVFGTGCGSGAEGATSGRGGDIVVWTSGTGAYGGLTFNGSALKPLNDWNHDYYGHRVSVGEILAGSAHNPDARGLQSELSSIR